MKSGLEGRNNLGYTVSGLLLPKGLNEVRPRRPEQLWKRARKSLSSICLNEVRPRRPEQSCKRNSNPRCRWRRVSMKSGLEGRNNDPSVITSPAWSICLNEVRPRRPEQLSIVSHMTQTIIVVSMKSGLEGRNNTLMRPSVTSCMSSLNEVRPRRPEQLRDLRRVEGEALWVSMKSGLEGRNNRAEPRSRRRGLDHPSQ